MGKKPKVFKPGDYVFAKVKGYPAWPAKVVSLNGKKYSIYFYGTGETGNLPANDLFDYFEHKHTFLAKVLKRRDYNEGLAQIDHETTEAGLTSNANSLDTSAVEAVADQTINESTNKSETSMEMDVDTSVADTTVPEVVDPVPTDAAKIPKKRAAESANLSGSSPPTKTRKVEEPSTPLEPPEEEPSPTPEVSPVEEPIQPEEKEPEAGETQAEAEAEPAPIVAAEIPAEVPTASQTPTATRGRKPSVKTPQAPPRTPRRSVKQEVMSPVYEPHIPAPESVSRSGRKIKPKRYLDEETNENAAPPVSAKKIKIQPTTPVGPSVATPEEEQVAVTPPTTPTETPVPAPVVTLAPTANDSVPRKGRKKVAKQPTDFFTFISQSELEGLQEPPVHDKEGEQSKRETLLPAVLPSGKVVGVKLWKDWPESFASPEAQTQWTTTMTKNAIRLKEELENGQIKPSTIANQIETELKLSPEDIAAFRKQSENTLRLKKLKILKAEFKLLETEKRIKLALNFQDADTDLAIQLLDEMAELEVTKVMLLKNTGVVHFMKRVRRYVGNLSQWKLSDEETKKFNEKTQIIRSKAQICFDKFKSLFGIEDEKSFSEAFIEQSLLFKMHTNQLSSVELSELIEEPKEMLQPNAYSATIVGEELEKERKIQDQVNNKEVKLDTVKTTPKKTETTPRK